MMETESIVKRKSKINKLVIIIICIFAIWGVMFTTDIIRTKNDKAPIFCISFREYDIKSGYVGYTGILYRVEKTVIEVDGKTGIKYSMLPWF